MDKDPIQHERIVELFTSLGELFAEIVKNHKREDAPPPSSITTEEAARIINCSRSHVYVLFRAGKISGYRIGEAGIRIHRDSALEFRGIGKWKKKNENRIFA